MENEINVGFEILSTDVSNNSITVRPCSTQFKNNKETYGPLNINISNLDPSKDLRDQIIDLLYPTVKSIINSEQQTFVDKVNDFVNANLNKTISAVRSPTTIEPENLPEVKLTEFSKAFEIIV